MKDRSLAKKRPLSCAKGVSSPNGFKQSLKRQIRSFFLKGYLKATMDEIALEAQLSKPTIYQYFKTKEDLFFSLMIPVVEDTGQQMEEVEKQLESGQYGSGRDLIRDIFKGFQHSHDMDPDGFRVNQLFQQTGLVWELDDSTRQQIQEIGKRNYVVARRLVEKAISLGLLKERNVYQLVDVLWGGFLGVVQICDIKSQKNLPNNSYTGRWHSSSMPWPMRS